MAVYMYLYMFQYCLIGIRNGCFRLYWKNITHNTVKFLNSGIVLQIRRGNRDD